MPSASSMFRIGQSDRCESQPVSDTVMKKIKNEKEMVKKALAIGMAYGEKRGAVEFEPTDSVNDRLEYIYRLLVHDKLLQPLPEEQVSQQAIRHKLAIWASKQKLNN